MECPQYSIRLEALGCLCDYLSGRGLMTLSGHAHLDRQRYVACRQAVSEVAENLRWFLVWRVQFTGMTLNWFQIETRHSVERSLGNEFPSIYNHCGVMAAWSRKTLEKIHFLRFWKNDPIRGKFQNCVPKGFIPTPIDVLCSNFVKFGWR